MMDNNKINERISDLYRIEKEAAELKARADAIRDELKAELDRRKEDSVDTGLHKVFYNCYEKSSVDTAKLKAAGLYNEYAKKSVVIQFRITDVKTV